MELGARSAGVLMSELARGLLTRCVVHDPGVPKSRLWSQVQQQGSPKSSQLLDAAPPYYLQRVHKEFGIASVWVLQVWSLVSCVHCCSPAQVSHGACTGAISLCSGEEKLQSFRVGK